MSDCECCDSCCPEAVSEVTINTTELDADNALELNVTNTGGATGTTEVEAQVVDIAGADVAGNFLIRFWFVDTNSKSANKSVVFPTTPGVNELEKVTADDGSVTFDVEHTGALDEWYICAELLGLVYIAGPIDLGV